MDSSYVVNALYELYRMDWMRRISVDRQMDAYKNYLEGLDFSDEIYKEYSFDDYIEEFGYDGELYACEDEFVDCELRNKEYMYSLIGDCEPLKQAYEKYFVREEKERE